MKDRFLREKIVRLAYENPSLRKHLLPLVNGKVASNESLELRVTKLAYANPKLRNHLVPLIKQANFFKKIMEKIKKMFFKNKETGKKVKFDSLPQKQKDGIIESAKEKAEIEQEKADKEEEKAEEKEEPKEEKVEEEKEEPKKESSLSLKLKLVRLAYENPSLRKDFLPLITKSAKGDYKKGDKIPSKAVYGSKDSYDEKLKDGKIFVVLPRDSKNSDPYMMYLTDKSFKVLKVLGTHPTLRGSKAWLKSNKSKL